MKHAYVKHDTNKAQSDKLNRNILVRTWDMWEGLVGKAIYPLVKLANLTSPRQRFITKDQNMLLSFKQKLLNRRLLLLSSLVLLIALPLAYLSFTYQPEAEAVKWWPSGASWENRKQLDITNNSAGNLSSGTTITVTVDTKALHDSGKLQNDCDDLRILYQPNSSTATDLTRHLVFPDGTTCSTSTATKVFFKLQAALNSATSTNTYYMYYDNESAGTPSSTDDAFDIGSADATLVCPFDGTTTCAAGETPSTESGAVRYSGSKSALSFDGNDDRITLPNTFDISPSTAFTIEYWFKANNNWSNPSGGSCDATNKATHFSGTWLPISSGQELISRTTSDKIKAANLTSDTSLVDGTWYHIAFVGDGSTLRLFQNGTQVASEDQTYANLEQNGTTITSTRLSAIGSNVAYSGTYYCEEQALFDDIRISNSARYTSDFTAPSAPFVRDSNTVVLYHFDENGDDPRNTGKAIDDSGNGNHGTITGTKYVSGLVGVNSSTSETGNIPRNSYAGHDGVFIEEATTNKITNPSFENTSTFDTGWSDAEATYVSTTTFTNGGGGDTINATVPTVQDGDIAIVSMSGTKDTIPSGYTTIYEGSGGNFYWRQMSASDSDSSESWVRTTTGGWFTVNYTIYRNAELSDSDTASITWTGASQAGTVDAPAVTLASAGIHHISTHGHPQEVTSWPSGYTERLDWSTGGHIHIADDSLSSGSTGTPTVDYTSGPYAGSGRILSLALSSDIVISENTDATYILFGNSSAKVETATDSAMTIDIDPDSTATHTMSAYVYDGTSGNIGGNVDNTIAQIYFEGTAQSSTTYTDAGGGWWRLEYSASTTDSTNEYGIYVPEGKTIYIDGIQLEEKSYTTTFTDGSLGTGYSWSGTENDSTSSRTATDLSYATSGNLSGTAGSVSFWVKSSPTVNIWNSDSHNTFLIDTSTFNYIRVHSSNLLQMFWGGANITVDSSGYDQSQWQHIVGTWTGSTTTLYRNGSSIGSDTFSSFTPSTLNVGRNSTTDYADGTISDFRILDSALDSTEVADLYYSGLISHSQGNELDRAGGFDSASKGLPPSAIWHMDEGYGTTAYDSTKLGNNLTVSGATWNKDSADTQNPRSTTFKFDGTDDYLSRTTDGDFDFGTESFTINGSFRHPSTISGTDTILARYGSAGYKVYMDSSGYICFAIDDDSTWTPDDSACTTTSYADSKWHTFSAVKNGTSSITLYIDGNQQAQDASISATGSLNSGSTLYLGIDSDASSNPWDGFLDEFTVYPYARSAAQVKSDLIGKQSSAVLGAQTSDPLSEGLVVYYPMDEASADTCGASNDNCDKSGNGLDGAWNGTATSAVGKFGNGVTLDGDSDFVSTSTVSTSGFNGISMGAWVKTTDSAGQIALNQNSSGGYVFYVNRFTSGKAVAIFDGSSGNNDSGDESSTTITDGEWHHLFATNDGTTTKLYVDGALENTYQETQTTGSSTQYVGSNNGTQDYWDGEIDEYRLYNRTLSFAEIRQLYNWAPGPVTHYKFDEGTGTTNVEDSSGNDNQATMNGTMTESDWVIGKYGKALDFDGSDDYLSMGDPSSLDNSGAFTFEAWVKVDTDSSGWVLHKGGYSSSDGVGIHYGSSTDQFYFKGNGVGGNDFSITSDTIALNTWYHVAGVYDGSNQYIYLDGIKQTTTDNEVDNFFDLAADIELGGDSAQSYDIDGKIDDVRIYNYARTQKQIIQDLNGGHPTGGSPIASQIGYWKLDEQQGQTVNDSGFAGNNGTLGASSSTSSDDPTWRTQADCKFGGCAEFDGSADIIDIGDISDFDFDETDSKFTVTLWANIDTLPTATGNEEFVGKYTTTGNQRGWVFGIQEDSSSGYPFMAISEDGTYSDSTTLELWSDVAISTGSWVHYAYTVDVETDTFNIFINGKQVAATQQNSKTTITDIYNNTANVTIGALGNPVGWIDGKLDEVKIYNDILTSEEILIDMSSNSGINFATTANDADDLTDGAGNPPVAEWNFNEGVDNTCADGVDDVCDTSGNGEDGASQNGPTWGNSAQCAEGKCLVLDGTDNYVQVTDSSNLSLTGSYTLEAWVNMSSVTASPAWALYPVIGKTDSGNRNGYVMYYDPGDGFRAGHCDASTCAATTSYSEEATIGQWYHVVAVHDTSASTINIYVDGLLRDSTATGGTDPTDGSGTLRIGYNEGNTYQHYLPASVDGVKIYDYALSQTQVAYQHNRGAPIAHYKLDECTGTSVYSSNNVYDSNLDGTITIGGSGDNTSVGTCTGSSGEAWYEGASGKFSSSLDFGGTDDYVEITDTAAINFEESLTVATWIKSTCNPSGTTECRLIQKGGGSENTSLFVMDLVDASGTDRAQFCVDNQGDGGSGCVRSTSEISSGSDWTHLLGTWDGTTLNLYVNGVLETTKSYSSAMNATAGNLRFGARPDGSGDWYNGQLDDIRLYNYPLSAAQVLKVMNEGAGARFGD